jgi:hypothetical protein
VDDALPAQLADRLARIAWLAARSHGVRLDDVLDPPPFTPKATRARMMAIAIAAGLVRCDAAVLGRYFGDCADAIAMACAHAVARAEYEPEFRTTMNFLKSSCAAVLG